MEGRMFVRNEAESIEWDERKVYIRSEVCNGGDVVGCCQVIKTDDWTLNMLLI